MEVEQKKEGGGGGGEEGRRKGGGLAETVSGQAPPLAWRWESSMAVATSVPRAMAAALGIL